MTTRLTCSQGHTWDSSAVDSAPLVCPSCGRPPIPDSSARSAEDAEQTIDLPSGPPTRSPPPVRGSAPSPRQFNPRPSEVTQTMHFTPAPSAPARPSQGNTFLDSRAPSGRSPFSSSSNKSAAVNLAMPFTILRQHARGGLGLVNLARDEHINREVALKQILPQHADNAGLQKRFLYEAQITGQLEHPSIVPVYTLGTDAQGLPYYVMRFVRGRTLDAIISEHHQSAGGANPIVFRELLRRFIAVCQAVAYAHSRGIIHRDLKPANIMLGDYGETLVLDWGLAKDIKNKSDAALEKLEGGSQKSEGSEVTIQGQIIGTPAYMAPEQAEGRTDLHGPVTDIYALGGILYKILAGQSPTAPAGSVAGADGQRRLNFVASPPPSTISGGIPPLLEQICMRAMATDPGARYPRALELAQDIQRWLDEHPLSLRPATRTAKVAAALRVQVIPLLIILIGLVGILIVLVIVKSGH